MIAETIRNAFYGKLISIFTQIDTMLIECAEEPDYFSPGILFSYCLRTKLLRVKDFYDNSVFVDFHDVSNDMLSIIVSQYESSGLRVAVGEEDPSQILLTWLEPAAYQVFLSNYDSLQLKRRK